ncbi:MAG: DivIVA domain-containing protein [Nocardioidaceae bacterium]
MTQQPHEHLFPYYRTPSAIRNEVFGHRVRGFDEAEVREYLDLLADQVQAAESEQAEVRAENERLRQENDRLRSDIERQRSVTPPPIPPQPQPVPQAQPQPQDASASRRAEALLRQAQQAADQLVEEAVRYARQVMTSARAEQREILQRAHEAAESAAQAARVAEARSLSLGHTAQTPEIEQVRNYAHVAQVQLRAILESLAYQVDRLGAAPSPPARLGLPQATHRSPSTITARATYQLDPRDSHWHSDRE